MPILQHSTHRAAAGGHFPSWLGPVLLALGLVAAGIPHSAAHADGILTWIVKSISSNEDGDLIRASTLQVPQVGAALTTGQRISTTAGQRMVLVNGRDLVEVSANTTVTIGDNDSATDEGNVDLVSGSIHVEVGKRAPGQTFSIGAPYLVATVKGTKFDVSTTTEASAVSVSEGVVAVSAKASGASIDVTVGNTAIVGRRTTGAPTLAPTPAGSAPSAIGLDDDTATASADTGHDASTDGGTDSGGSGAAGGSSAGSSSSSDSGGSTSGSGSGAGGAVGGATGAVGGAVGGATGAVGGAVSGATGAVGGAVGGATGAVGGAIGGPVGGAVSGVGGALGGAVSGVGGAVGGAVSGVGGAVGGALGGVGGALGGGLGGLGRQK
jgi:hypothetical protein